MTSEGGFKNNRRSFPRESFQCARLRQSQSWHRLRRGSSHHDCQVQQWIVFMSSIQYIQLMLPKHKHLPKRDLYVIQAGQPSGKVLAPRQWGCRFKLYTLFHAHLAVQEAHATRISNGSHHTTNHYENVDQGLPYRLITLPRFAVLVLRLIKCNTHRYLI